ncbi:MAG: septum site-determining protein MinC, partial [Gammaproteobacteria bacterium]
MSTDQQSTSYQRPVVEFKSSTFSVPVLALTENDLSVITEQLKIKIKQAPEFFNESPVIVDLNRLSEQQLDIDLSALLDALRSLNLQPIGIRGAREDQKTQAQEIHIPLLAEQRTSAANVARSEPAKIVAQPPEEESATTESLLITQPIRSGQRVYATGDLIIVASVSAGAEIMAEGNIHVYGALRGRALAGVQGNENSRIFCSDLQAELVSIAGNFKISE